MHVHKPVRGGKDWVVTVSESISPLSDTIERIEFSSREAAWQGYRQIMKELGRGL